MIGSANPGGDGWRWIPRVLFFVPKWAFIVATAPVRLGLWAYDRYRLRYRFLDIFFTDDQDLGIYPSLFFETGFGLSVGARFIHKDLFGYRERLRAGAGFGGRYRQIYYAEIDSGDRFGEAFLVGLEAVYERRQKDLFYGIGNADESDPTGVPIEPTTSEVAVKSRFRQDIARFSLRARLGLAGSWSLRPRAALVYRDFDTSDSFADEDIADNYDVLALVGFVDGTSSLSGELELRYDSRRRASEWQSEVIEGAGWLLSGFAGWQEGFDDDPSSFVRYGADVQTYIDLYKGNRILGLRLFLEAVGGPSSDVDEVPFTDLPRLSGPWTLRGYDRDRFRDRIAALASATYTWNLGNSSSAFLFADAGRPYRAWEDVADTTASSVRLGFGGGIIVHTDDSFLARAHLASSVDGGAFVVLSLSPYSKPRDRLGRP